MFANNVLGKWEYASDSSLVISNCMNANVTGNHFPDSYHHQIKADTVNGLNIQGNHFGIGTNTSAAHTIKIFGSCPKVLVSNNYKPQPNTGAAYESLVSTDAAGSIEQFTAIGNQVSLRGNRLSSAFSIHGKAIGGMTRANPCVVTWTAHGMDSGQKIKFNDITQAGWTALNGTGYVITRLSADTFSIAVDTSGYAADYDPGTDPGTYWFQEVANNVVFGY